MPKPDPMKFPHGKPCEIRIISECDITTTLYYVVVVYPNKLEKREPFFQFENAFRFMVEQALEINRG